jgi:hypothetical protein
MYNSWFDYVIEFEKALDDEPDRIHLTYYEDLKEVGFYVNFCIITVLNLIIRAYYDAMIKNPADVK